MTKFYGVIGFAITEETTPGIYREIIEERLYAGDVIRESIGSEGQEKINLDLTLTNRISIIGDSFAFNNLTHIRFIKWRGNAWNVSSAEIVERRVVLSFRGVYNGQ